MINLQSQQIHSPQLFRISSIIAIRKAEETGNFEDPAYLRANDIL